MSTDHVWVVTRGYYGNLSDGFPVVFRSMKGVREHVARQAGEWHEYPKDRRSRAWWSAPMSERPADDDQYIFARWQRVYE